MPSFYFFSKPVERILPVNLQAVALSYLSVDALNHVANTSKELSKAVLSVRPKPSGTLHKKLQVFRELQGIHDGYQVLHQSDLPDWLKARWSVKRNVLAALSQGMIALKINTAIPLSERHEPTDYALALSEIWPRFDVFIHKNSVAESNKPLVDTLSLRALLANYTLELLWNGKVVGNQQVALALLEIVEIFLSAKNPHSVQEGLIMLDKDLEGENILLTNFLSHNGLMARRNKLLDFKQEELLYDSGSDDEVDDESKALTMKGLDFFLSASALIAYAKKYLSIGEVITAAQAGYENIIGLLLTANGLVLLEKGFLSLASIVKLTYNLSDQQRLALVQLWLTDASTHAFNNGFISLNQASVKVMSAATGDSFWVECRAMLTPFALDTLEYFVINLNDINTVAEWDDLLTQLNKSIDLSETESCSPRPR